MFEKKISLAMLARIVGAKNVLNGEKLVPLDDKPMLLAEKLGRVVRLSASLNKQEVESEGSELAKMLAEHRSKRGQ